MGKKRTRIYEHTAENDLKYRGPLGPVSFKALGWFCVILATVAALLNLAGQLDKNMGQWLGGIANVLYYVSRCSLPFLLMSNFSSIMNNNDGYKGLLLKNGGAAIAIILVFYLFGGRYFIGTLQKMVIQKEEILPALTEIFYILKPSGYLAFNMFIDLFLCVLVMYFLNARPKRVFTGNKTIILRLFVILPIAYEGVCLWFKIQSALGKVRLPLWAMPLLTMKPPMMVLLFIFIAFLIKFREWRFCKHGRTYEEYQEFMQSNRNSFNLSVRLAISMAVFAIIDLILWIILMYGLAGNYGQIDAKTGEIVESSVNSLYTLAQEIGIGEAWPMLLVAPLMLLYSYSRVPKNKMISLLFPAVSIVIIVLILCEAIRIGAGVLMTGKEIDLNQVRETVTSLMGK